MEIFERSFPISKCGESVDAIIRKCVFILEDSSCNIDERRILKWLGRDEVDKVKEKDKIEWSA